MRPIVFLKNHIFYIISFSFFFLLALFIYRSLLLNISTNLLDWNDYPLFVWIMQHNIEHFRTLTFNNFFDTNIFYPFQGNLLFSDLFLPTSIVGYILSFFTTNPIAVFNYVFVLVLIINPIASLFFWRNFFSSKRLLFFATLTSAFSPFTIINSYHFQMLNIWPIFFCLGFLLRKDLTFKNAVFGGIFLAVQFWTGVYYAIFALFIIAIWYLIKIWAIKESRIKLIVLFRRLFIFLITFLFLAGIFIIKYLQVKNAYDITREYWEYVVYAAHPTDYLFLPYKSLLTEINIIQKWNSFNHHGSAASFPGFVLLAFGLIGIFSYRKINQIKTVILKLQGNTLFFLILICSGFIFSLGPRLSVNGVYVGIPLPYSIVLKIMPLFEAIRADSRWSFLVYFGLTYFACLGIEKLAKSPKKEIFIVITLSILYTTEIIPINRDSISKQYYNSVYDYVKNICSSKKTVLLEYPLTQDKKAANIVTNLSYKTQMLLASTNHRCNLVNGYSGYTPKDYERYETELYMIIPEGGEENFYKLLKQRNVDLFKLNKQEIYSTKAEVIELWLKDKKKFSILISDNQYTIAKLL